VTPCKALVKIMPSSANTPSGPCGRDPFVAQPPIRCRSSFRCPEDCRPHFAVHRFRRRTRSGSPSSSAVNARCPQARDVAGLQPFAVQSRSWPCVVGPAGRVVEQFLATDHDPGWRNPRVSDRGAGRFVVNGGRRQPAAPRGDDVALSPRSHISVAAVAGPRRRSAVAVRDLSCFDPRAPARDVCLDVSTRPAPTDR